MTRRIRQAVAGTALVLLATTLAACGGGSSSKTAQPGTRTINVEMRDIAFSPSQLDVRSGETVRFVFHNAGKVNHDAYIGTEQAQGDHEMEMSQNGDMSNMHHGSTNGEGGITVKPGKTGTLTHTFSANDKVLIGCHQPGHYAAGMKVTINQA